MPVGDSLPLGFDFRATVEGTGQRILATIEQTIDDGGKRGDDFAAELGLDPGQLSRALHGRGAHFSVRWLPAVLWRDRSHRVVSLLAPIAGGEYVHRPVRSREEENEALRRYIEVHLGDLGQDVLRKALGDDES